MAEPVLFMKNLASDSEATTLRLGHKRFSFFFSPEAAQEILTKRAQIYVQNRMVFDRIQPVTGKKGLVQLTGLESQQARAKSRPMFMSAGLDSARLVIESYCDDLILCFGESATVDITEEMTALILRTAIRIFLGIDSKELVSQIGTKFLRLNHLCGLRMRSLLPAPLSLPTPTNLEIKSLQAEIRFLIEREVVSSAEFGVPKVFHGDPNRIDHCMTFLFAGHETTAASLAFSLLLLAQYQKYQDPIANGDDETATAVYKESLRLYPPAYMLARQASADDQLQGVSIKRGDQVILGITELHRNNRHFDGADQFFPERFFGKLQHPFSFLPFGAGGKSCVGERLAYLEAGIVLKKLCQKYRISASPAPIQAEPLITLHPLRGQTVRFQARDREAHV
jgi:cytochrome P450